MKDILIFLNSCTTEHLIFYLATMLIAFSVVIMAITKIVIEIIQGVMRTFTMVHWFFKWIRSHTAKNDHTAAI